MRMGMMTTVKVPQGATSKSSMGSTSPEKRRRTTGAEHTPRASVRYYALTPMVASWSTVIGNGLAPTTMDSSVFVEK